jgi:hypothetical protein
MTLEGKEYLLVKEVNGEERYRRLWAWAQKLRESEDCLRVLTSVGVVIMPDMTHKVFRNYQSDRFLSEEKSPGNVFDIPTFEEMKPHAETSGVAICGVFAAECDDYKFMMHAVTPLNLRALIGRGIDFAEEHGADLGKTFRVSLYRNPKDCSRIMPASLEGPTSYDAQIQELAKSAGLEFVIQPREVCINDRITI